MNKLVEEIIKPILEANSKITKVVGIYGGRFQPFGPHHYKTYKWLAKQVDDAYITTSNIKKPPRHPMNFKEKVRHMSKMGVPSNRIIEEKSPYKAINLAKKYDKDTTAFIFIFGAKDAGRLSGGKYFQDYKKNKNNLNGYEENGYVLTAPHVSISVGGQEVSGTSMRDLLGSDKVDDKQRVKLFKKMFGYFNDGVFQMMTNKFKKLFEVTGVGAGAMGGSRPTGINNKLIKVKSKSGSNVNSKLGAPYTDDDDDDIEESDINVVPYSKSNKKKKDPKLFDKKKKDLIKGEKNKELEEAFTIPIEIGDTVLMGKFKNKKVVVKTIGFNEKGDVVINGKSASKFRLTKQVNIFDEETIKEFLTTIDMKDIIDEATSTDSSGIGAVDSGPSALMKGIGGYVGRNKEEAEKLGWEVVNYILDVDISKIPPIKSEFGGGKSVSYMPAGIGTGGTPNNPENLTGAKGYNKWVKNMKSVAQEVGFKLMKFKDEKDLKKQISKDTKATLKQQKKDEKEIQQESVFSKQWWKENLLLEGGAYGHMAHPFDDKDLTFGDLKKIIESGLGGTLNREDNVTEKLDGQNIMISWKDGKLIAARNKGHIKNGGKTALTKSGIKSKFEGRGEIANAFNFAMDDLEKAIKGLSDKQKEKIFNNGYNFMNMEVMWPSSANVIDYDVANLVFHGALKYDDSGIVKGEVKGSARILAGMIQQVNKHIGKKYSIGKPNFLDVPKHQDFGKMKDKFLGRLNKLRSDYGLKDSDTLALYHQRWWEQKISQTFGSNISGLVEEGLVKRWAFFDKSYSVADIKKDMKRFIEANPKKENITQAILKFDKKDHASQVKNNMKPFEVLFFAVGAEILKNVKGFMAVNPDKAVQGIKKRIDKAISDVRKGGDLKKLNTLKLQLDKLQAIGGINSIVPSEGIVFKYKGNTYKFTGAFAPVNQITGLISF